MSLAESLAIEFAVRDWQWKIGGVLQIPSAEDISDALKEMSRMLEPESDETQVLVGRLIMRKSEGHKDVYIHYGEYK